MATFLKEKIFLGTKSLRGDNPRPRRRVAAPGAGAGAYRWYVLRFVHFKLSKRRIHVHGSNQRLYHV